MNCSHQYCGRPLVSNVSLEDGVTIRICNLPLVPSWMLAVLIGVYFGYKYLSLGPAVTGSLSYGITYFMYAVMISSGLVVHCLCLYECTGDDKNHTLVFKYSAIVDVSLTCCIAITFAFDGLVDLKWIPERSYFTWGTAMSMYGLVFFSYIQDLKISSTLYFNSIVIGCSIYMLSQLPHLINHISLTEVIYYILAGLTGGISLILIKYRYCWLCNVLGPWSIQGIWYYGSDASMLFLGLYILKTRKVQINSGTVQIEK